MTTLGIDLGTGSVKAAVVGDDGRVVSRASHPYRVRAPHAGWAEGDPREWLTAAREVVASATSGLTQSPTAIGFSGQMHGVVVTDEHFTPLRPAILWADTRAAAEAGDLGRALPRALLSGLGSPAVTGLAATTIAWLMRNEPEVMSKAAHLLQPKDWLRAKFGGSSVTDPSDASGTLMFDVIDGEWSPAVLDWLGIDRDLLPTVASSTDADGEGRVVGAADTACAIVGLGLQPGEGYLAVGTGAQVVRLLDAPVVDETLRTHTFAIAGAARSGWYRLGAVQSGGLALKVALEMLDATPEEAAKAMQKGVAIDDPMFVPYLSGERTPFMDSSLRGSWHGLSLSTDRDAMLRSVLEGIAQAVALGVEAVQESGAPLPDTVALIGGGSHAPAFRQLLSDATGLSLVVTDAPDAAVIGAALLAAGHTSNPRAAASLESITPNVSAGRMLSERRAMMVAYAKESL